ncbi:MAG: YkgJ family cysteine cluster protein [SAR324 cluster bacterium]|nr:YkgJ family cysteine cluster protein [SAR324 cluster bacterium]
MDGTVNDKTNDGSNTLGFDRLDALQENLLNDMYAIVDEATRRELNRLYVEEGVISTCKPGCFHCCGQNIITNIVEAHALTDFIKHEFSPSQIEDLKLRTQQWHEWDKDRPVRADFTHKNKQIAFSAHRHCPMLVEGTCTAYTVRPLVCRRHFVSSNPPACRPFFDPESVEDNPVALMSVVAATNQFSMKIRDLIESTGLNFYDSVMLLPHWLAIEMNWDFMNAP